MSYDLLQGHHVKIRVRFLDNCIKKVCEKYEQKLNSLQTGDTKGTGRLYFLELSGGWCSR